MGCLPVVGVLGFFGKVQTEPGHGVVSTWNEMGDDAGGAGAAYDCRSVCPESVSEVSNWAELGKQEDKEIRPDLFLLWFVIRLWRK